jgi:hypothetical protein
MSDIEKGDRIRLLGPEGMRTWTDAHGGDPIYYEQGSIVTAIDVRGNYAQFNHGDQTLWAALEYVEKATCGCSPMFLLLQGCTCGVQQ